MLNTQTARYLKRNGVSAENIQALDEGRPVCITADSLTSWIKGAFTDGASHSRRSLAVALLPQIEALVELAKAEGAAKVWSDAHDQIIRAEAKTDRLCDEVHDMKASLQCLSVFEKNHRRFWAIVADCQQWFNGFAAAHAGRDSWDQPRIPNPDTLRDLNAALSSLDVSEDEDVPF